MSSDTFFCVRTNHLRTNYGRLQSSIQSSQLASACGLPYRPHPARRPGKRLSEPSSSPAVTIISQ